MMIRFAPLLLLLAAWLPAVPALAQENGRIADPGLNPASMPDTRDPVPLASNDTRRQLIDRLLVELPVPERLGDIARYVDLQRWTWGLRRELQRGGMPTRYHFLGFLTPGPDPPEHGRTRLFDLAETLRRCWRHAAWECLGTLAGNRIVYRASRSVGDEPEQWRVVFTVALSHEGLWFVTRIDDATRLRCCLLEERRMASTVRNPLVTAATATDVLGWHVVTAAEALAACRRNAAPRRGAGIARPEFEHYGVIDPLMRPWLMIEALHPSNRCVSLGSRYPGPLAVGRRIHCYAGRPYRIVAISEDGIRLRNPLGYMFDVSADVSELPPEPGWVVISPDGADGDGDSTHSQPDGND